MNEEIRSAQVHLIDQNGRSHGTVSLDQALWLAWESELDLVEVGPNANPPVVKVLDYGKYQYEQSKSRIKGRAHQPDVKEIRLSFAIGQHDFDVKQAQAQRWLSDGDRVRVTVKLVGRQNIFAGRARDVIERMRVALDASYDGEITKTGNRFGVILGRKKK
ncbi:translation initiation factor IF-3 [Candidatus Berkelbacteria bacterium]|nr:translation initiation factor IF-3 [Candidatus Berkelbacteria bacterium]